MIFVILNDFMVFRFYLFLLNCLKYINILDIVKNMNMNKFFIVIEIFLRKNIYVLLRKLLYLVVFIYMYTYICLLSLIL